MTQWLFEKRHSKNTIQTKVQGKKCFSSKTAIAFLSLLRIKLYNQSYLHFFCSSHLEALSQLLKINFRKYFSPCSIFFLVSLGAMNYIFLNYDLRQSFKLLEILTLKTWKRNQCMNEWKTNKFSRHFLDKYFNINDRIYTVINIKYISAYFIYY